MLVRFSSWSLPVLLLFLHLANTCSIRKSNLKGISNGTKNPKKTVHFELTEKTESEKTDTFITDTQKEAVTITDTQKGTVTITDAQKETVTITDAQKETVTITDTAKYNSTTMENGHYLILAVALIFIAIGLVVYAVLLDHDD